jgi:hypothetical protein
LESLQIIPLFITIIVLLTTFSYAKLKDMTSVKGFTRIEDFAAVPILTIYLVPLFFLFFVGSHIAQEPKNMAQSLLIFSNDQTDAEILSKVGFSLNSFMQRPRRIPCFIVFISSIQKVKIFLSVLHLRSPALSCGLFKFDWTLALSLFATISSYLIILCQFDSSGDGFKSNSSFVEDYLN